MRVDATDADARIFDAALHECGVTARNSAIDQTRLDFSDGVDETDVRGDMQNTQLGSHEHHGDFRRAGQMREKFGVAGKLVAGGMEGFFIQRRGANGTNLAIESQLRRDRKILIGRFSGLGREFSPG
jgi:hypothetical protein